MKIIELILRNLFILQLGILIRLAYLRLIKKNTKVTYSKLLHGIDPVKTKEDEIFNTRNEFVNRIYSLVFLFLLVVIIVLLTWK